MTLRTAPNCLTLLTGLVARWYAECLAQIAPNLIPPQERFLTGYPELLGPANALDNQYGGVVLPALGLLWKVGNGEHMTSGSLMLILR